MLRGGRSRFVVESKLFEIVVEDLGGKLKGCVETCCREVDDQRWVIEWMEGNRKFRMERWLNKAGSGWNSLAVRLRGLGVVPSEGLKFTNVLEVPLKSKGVLKVQWKEKGVETMSFADAVKLTLRRAGRWGSISAPLPELEYLKRPSVFWPEAKEALRKIVLSWTDGTQRWVFLQDLQCRRGMGKGGRAPTPFLES
ncbi:hypothetical protein CK203_034665 [Vitis vinifera]|uniref:Uncharacterized protein n=1 Tax=Vitis vinifera TaxID=29760 RepID=A0A438HWI1_VITVI|nr:hypothetical protein CK203_034665 [Vitis vinifera]